jgi:hypothetical protein
LLASAGHELRCGTEVSPQMVDEAVAEHDSNP